MSARIFGTTGDDTLTGTAGNDYFANWQTGGDTLSGLDGNDTFAFSRFFDNTDHVDGGTGFDVIRLAGNYSDGVIFAPTTIQNVEQIQVAAGDDYNLTLAAGNATGIASLSIYGAALGAGDVLTVDGSAIGATEGQLRLIGGAGDDVLTGGHSGTVFDLSLGGDDTATGGDSNDFFRMGSAFDASDKIDGGAGIDTVFLEGMGLNDSITFNADTLVHVERLVLDHGFDYHFISNDANIVAGAKMLVLDMNLDPGAQLSFDGSAETDGHFNFDPEAATATLTGGALSDRFDLSQASDSTVTGGGGADHIIASNANTGDTFVYNAASESTSTHYDTIQNVNFADDTFQAPFGDISVSSQFFGGALSFATFNDDLTTLVGKSLVNHGAEVFTPNSGDLAGHSFLVIDVNGTLGYQAGQDLVIDVTGYTGLGT